MVQNLISLMMTISFWIIVIVVPNSSIRETEAQTNLSTITKRVKPTDMAIYPANTDHYKKS